MCPAKVNTHTSSDTKKYWLYRFETSNESLSLLLRHGYILMNISNNSPALSVDFSVNDIIIVPIESNLISFFEIKDTPNILKKEWYKIKNIFVDNDKIECVNFFEELGLENILIIKVKMLKEYIPIADCENMEFTKYAKMHRTLMNITNFAEEINSILSDPEKTSDVSFLLSELSKSNDIDEYINSHKNSIVCSDHVEYLQYMLIEKGLTIAKVGEYSGQRDYVYKIFKGKREPGRDVLLTIAVGMGFTLGETQKLLKLSRHIELSVKDSRDVVIIFGILKSKSVQEINDMLYENKQATLFD